MRFNEFLNINFPVHRDEVMANVCKASLEKREISGNNMLPNNEKLL